MQLASCDYVSSYGGENEDNISLQSTWKGPYLNNLAVQLPMLLIVRTTFEIERWTIHDRIILLSLRPSELDSLHRQACHAVHVQSIAQNGGRHY
jgi:hypothetical protein